MAVYITGDIHGDFNRFLELKSFAMNTILERMTGLSALAMSV